jgi:diguanylate cyclase (GGDEF)-like protein/PAS domain S-box-containing protein
MFMAASPMMHRSLRLLAAALMVAGTSWAGIWMTRDVAQITTIWFANGILIGLIVRSGWKRWPLYLVAGLFGNLFAEAAAGHFSSLSVGLSLCNTLEVGTAGVLLRRFVDRELVAQQLAARAGSILAVVLGAPLLPSFLGGWMYASTGNGSAPLENTAYWYAADVLGILIMMPVVFAASSMHLSRLLKGKRRLRNALSLCLLIVATTAVFCQDAYPFLFVEFPPLLMVVFGMELMGAAIGLLIVCFIAIGFTACDHGPFLLIVHTATPARMLFVQFYVAVASLMAYPVGVVLANRRALARRMRENEHRYRTLSENCSDVIVCASLDGDRTYVSPSVTDVLGWTPAEILGPARADLIHPDDREAFLGEYHALLNGARASVSVYRYRHRAGHYVWVESRSRLTSGTGDSGEDEIVKVVRDISVRKQMENALAKNEEDLRAITDNVPALISFLDANGFIQFCNATHEVWFHRSRDSITGSHLSELLGAPLFEQQRKAFIGAVCGECTEVDLTIGQRRTHVSYVPRWTPSGEISGAYAITTDVTSIRAAEDELERLANFDVLTGLANRHQFNARLKQIELDTQPVGLLFLDLDNFKTINDTYGHGAGDETLIEVAQRLRSCVRDGDFVARLAGDEFVVLLPQAKGKVEAERVAQRIVEAMQVPFHSSFAELPLSVSVGVARSLEAPNDAQALLKAADEALYVAKDAGRNTWRVSILGKPSEAARPAAA